MGQKALADMWLVLHYVPVLLDHWIEEAVHFALGHAGLQVGNPLAPWPEASVAWENDVVYGSGNHFAFDIVS